MSAHPIADSMFERGYKTAPVGGLIFTEEARENLEQRVKAARERLAVHIQKGQNRGWSKEPFVLTNWMAARERNGSLQTA